MDQQPKDTNLGKFEWIVAYLMQRLLNEGRHCLTDNWYSSQRLADHLGENETTLTGTIRTNRGVPEALRDAKLNRHDSAFMRKGNTLYCKYEDKKSVYMITTKYKADMLRAERITFQGEERWFQRPYVVDRYNNLMGGVGKCDQCLYYYGNNRKSLTWFKKIGIHFIERMLECLRSIQEPAS